MPPTGKFARGLKWRLWKVPVDEEVDRELAFHLEMLVRDNVARGMTPEAARAAALQRFGDVRDINAVCKDIGQRRDDEMQRTEWLSELRQDVGYALRHLRSNRGFTAVAAMTLALGIGASTTIFGVADAVVLRPFPFPQADRMVRVWETNPGTQYFSTSQPNYLDWRAKNRTFAELAAFARVAMRLEGRDEPEQLRAIAVTPNYFRVIGVAPALGRALLDEEGRPGVPARVVVLSHGLWQRLFGGDPGALGRTLRLDGAEYQVVGVMPARYDFPRRADLWTPLAPSPTASRGDHRLAVLGRLRPGATLERALADLQSIAAELAKLYPDSNRDWGVHMEGLGDWLVGRELRTRVLVLLGAVGLLLLMACVNVANLLLARAGARGREMSVRAALGAGRGRIVRQLMTESLVLAALGAALGVALTAAAIPLLRDVGGESVPRLNELRVDWRVLLFGVGASLVTGLLFGTAPALHASRTNLADALRGGARVLGTGPLRTGLTVASVALSMLLLVGAGLVGTSFARLMRVDPGFAPQHVLTGQIALGGPRYQTGQARADFWTELDRRLAAIPGVTAAGMTNVAPFSGGSTGIEFTVVGRAPAAPGEFLSTAWRAVTPTFFAAGRIPIKRGRGLLDADAAENAPPAIVISETFARRVWPGEDPIGKQIRLPRGDRPLTVVGVAGDLLDQSLETEPGLTMFFPHTMAGWPTMWMLVRTTAADPMSVAAALRREVRAMDPTLPVTEMRPLASLVTEVAAQPRLTTMIFLLFAAAALLLAVVGVYGLVAYSVVQRTREIGVRLALGARPAQIVRAVVREGAGLALLGIALGFGAAWALSHYLESILYGVTTTDATTYAVVAALLAACAVLASLIPARRAARLDPTLALRAE